MLKPKKEYVGVNEFEGIKLDDLSRRVEVPTPIIRDDHHKVGDAMYTDNGGFIIGNIAVVCIDKPKGIFDIQYYDENGEWQGSHRVALLGRNGV